MSRHKKVRLMIKNGAKLALIQGMSRALLVCLIYVAIPIFISAAVPQTVSDYKAGIFPIGLILLNLIVFMITAPLSYGLKLWFIRLLRKQKPKMSDFIYWFTDGDRLWKGLRLSIVVGVIKIFIGGGLFALSAIYPYLRLAQAQRLGYTFRWIIDVGAPIPQSEANFMISTILISYAVIFVALLLAIIIFQRFLLVKNIHASDYNVKIGKTLKLSARAMKGHYIETLKFRISFAGWLLFGFLTFGFGLAYAMPYYTAATTLYYEYLLDIYYRSQAQKGGGVLTSGENNKPLQERMSQPSAMPQGESDGEALFVEGSDRMDTGEQLPEVNIEEAKNAPEMPVKDNVDTPDSLPEPGADGLDNYNND